MSRGATKTPPLYHMTNSDHVTRGFINFPPELKRLEVELNPSLIFNSREAYLLELSLIIMPMKKFLSKEVNKPAMVACPVCKSRYEFVLFVQVWRNAKAYLFFFFYILSYKL